MDLPAIEQAIAELDIDEGYGQGGPVLAVQDLSEQVDEVIGRLQVNNVLLAAERGCARSIGQQAAVAPSMQQEIRRIIIINHGETVDKLIPNWTDSYDELGNLKHSSPIDDDGAPKHVLKIDDKDSPLSQYGKIGCLDVGYALGKAGVTAANIGGHIYCSPTYATIESAHHIARGIVKAAGKQPINDEIKVRIENGFNAQIGGRGQRFSDVFPKWLTPKEIQDGIGRRVDETYVPAVVEFSQEPIEQCYARMKSTIDKLIESMPNENGQTLLIVGHPATLEGCARPLYGGPLRSQFDFNRLCHQTPFCYSVRMSERSADVWAMAEPLVPLLPFAGNDA